MSFNPSSTKALARIATVCGLFCADVAPAREPAPPPVSTHPGLEFTPEEEAWLGTHPTVRVGFDPAWPPFSVWHADGSVTGIDIDLLRRLETMIPVHFEFVRSASWAETWARFERRELDMTSGTAATLERSLSAYFTDPYISFPVAIITRDDAPFLVGLSGLEGKTVAGPRGHVTTRFLEESHPGIRLLLTDTSVEAMSAVAGGRADAVVDNLATASDIIRRQGLTNLKIAGLTDERFELRFALRNDHPQLPSALRKALAAIPAQEKNRIIESWIPVDYKSAIDWQSVWRSVGVVVAFAGVLLGVTLVWNRKLAREVRSRRLAEEALRERESDLQQANAKLTRLHDEKDLLLKMAAHDLNNPLTTILILTDDAGISEAERNSEIRSCAEHMHRLIRNLVHAGREDAAGTHWMQPDFVDMASVIARVAERYRRTAMAKNVALRVETPPAGHAVARVDADAADQVVDNLLSNAIKYTRPPGYVTVRARSSDDEVRIEVIDMGPGIPKNEQPDLFKTFARLSPRPTGGESSFGLGLSIVRRLVEKMSGRVWCESDGSKGCTFTVAFPAAKNPRG